MRSNLSAFLAGALFSVGLVIAGMTQPGKVTAFLDITGDWDPSLAFVMIGAIAVHAPLRALTMRGERDAPLFGGAFSMPMASVVDRRLVIGSSLFGIGWGLAGYCPGPALASLGSGFGPVIFVGSMLGGMGLYRAFNRRFLTPAAVRADG